MTLLTLSSSQASTTTLVLLAAGRGDRFRASIPKHLAQFQGVPLAVRLVRQLRNAFTTTPVIVINDKDAWTAEVFETWGLPVRLVVQGAGRGSVRAMLDALPHCSENICVVLGDLILEGEITGAIDDRPAVGVWPDGPDASVRANFGVQILNEEIVRIVEKPEQTAELDCGMGVYFLPASLIRSFADTVTPDARGELGVTDLLAEILEGGVQISAAWFQGLYVNVNEPADLIQAERALFTAERSS